MSMIQIEFDIAELHDNGADGFWKYAQPTNFIICAGERQSLTPTPSPSGVCASAIAMKFPRCR